jgi:hypothetical protein
MSMMVKEGVSIVVRRAIKGTGVLARRTIVVY